MGNQLTSRRVGVDIETPEVNRNHQYYYPPPEGGKFFSTHYHLGSRKFENADESEHFLFGDLNDINYLTSAPAAFPYRQPPKKKPVECLYSLLNLHKETVKLVKTSDGLSYNIEFIFDCDVPCQIYVFYHLLDISLMDSLKHGTTPTAITKVSQCYQYDKGLEQSFKQCSLILSPVDWNEDYLNYSPDEGQNLYPIGILLETYTPDIEYQSSLTICKLETVSNGSYNIKVIKQKMLIDNMEYLMHEAFGLENKSVPQDDKCNDSDSDGSSDIDDDFGAECVICFTDTRDTILLPCRHLCICASCAGDLRYQASNCPICRSPFQALLQIQALQPLNPDEIPDDDELTDNQELYSVPGFKTMSLIQALNGYPKIKPIKATSSTTEIPMSTGDEEEEEHDLTNNETVIPIDGLEHQKEKEQDTLLITDHPVVTIVNGGLITVTASIEPTTSNDDDILSQTSDDFRKSSSSTTSSRHSSTSVNSFSSRDVLLHKNLN